MWCPIVVWAQTVAVTEYAIQRELEYGVLLKGGERENERDREKERMRGRRSDRACILKRPLHLYSD